MVAHSPISFPSVIEFGMAVPHSSEVFVNIEPKVTLAEKGTIKNFPIVSKLLKISTVERCFVVFSNI